jgi:hypothetical protein
VPVAATFDVSDDSLTVGFDRPLALPGAFVATTFRLKIAPVERLITSIALNGPSPGASAVRMDTAPGAASGGPPRVDYDAALQTIVSASGGVPAARFADLPCFVII